MEFVMNLLDNINSSLPPVSNKIYCYACNQTDVKLKKCGQCLNAYYCNVHCQKKDWNEHKIVCKTIVKNERYLQLKRVLKETNKLTTSKMDKEGKLLEIAQECLKEGFLDLANGTIFKHATLPIVKEKYFQVYSKYMVEKKESYSLILKTGNRIGLNLERVFRATVQELCCGKAFEEVCKCLTEIKDVQLHAILFNSFVVHLNLNDALEPYKEKCFKIYVDHMHKNNQPSYLVKSMGLKLDLTEEKINTIINS